MSDSSDEDAMMSSEPMEEESRGYVDEDDVDDDEEDDDEDEDEDEEVRSRAGHDTSTDEEATVVINQGSNAGFRRHDDGFYGFVDEDEDEDDVVEEEEDDEEDDDLDVHHEFPYKAPVPWPPPMADGTAAMVEAGAKKKKPGIVYLSSIPASFNVSRTITFFSQFGRVGRVFLQPDLKEKSRRRDKMARTFTEGWIEFLSKRIAKEVAAKLNGSSVGGSKRSKAYDALWNIKYLPRFKWTHLGERLAYDRASHQQKMRAEVSQAKREADFYRANVDKSYRLAKKQALEEPSSATPRIYEFRQKEPDEAVQKKRRRIETKVNNAKKKRGSKQDVASSSPLEAVVAAAATKTPLNNKRSQKSKRLAAKNNESQVLKRARTRSSSASRLTGDKRKEFLQSVFGKF